MKSEMGYFLSQEYDNLDAFRAIEAGLASLGFVDSTWHNDLCPSLSLETKPDVFVIVWIDYHKAELRDIPEGAEFFVHVMANGESVWERQCANPQEAIAIASQYAKEESPNV